MNYQIDNLHVLKKLCLQQGCTYEGRREALKKNLHIQQKVPIYVCAMHFFIPTCTIRSRHCIWINYFMIQDLRSFQGLTKIVFCNEKSICIHCDKRSIERELRLCALYLQFLRANRLL